MRDRIGLFAGCLLGVCIVWSSLARAQSFEVAGQSLRGYGVYLALDGNYAYVTMGSAMVAFDISNPSAPVEVGRAYTQNLFDASPALITFPGGKYFLASTDLFGVRVFEVTDPYHPQLAFTLFNPLPGKKVDGGGGVFYQNDLLYYANGARGLKIYRPQLSGDGKLVGFQAVGDGFPHPENQVTTDYYANVSVVGTKAYVSARARGLHIIDVSKPTAPLTLLGAYQIGGLVANTYAIPDNDNKIAILCRMVFLASCCGIETVDVSTPESVIAHVDYDSAYGFLELPTFRNLSKQGNTVAAADFVRGLYVFNIPASGTPITLIDRWVRPQTGQGLDYAVIRGNYAYMADYKGFLIGERQTGPYDAGTSMPIVGRADSDLALDLVIVDKIAYIADGPRGVVAVDVTDPTAPSIERAIAPTDQFSYATGIEHQDGYLYVADRDKGLLVLKLDAPMQASLSATYSTGAGASPEELLIANGKLYVANGDSGVLAYPISAPGTLGTAVPNPTAISGAVNRVVAYGGWIYALSGGTAAAVTALDPVTLAQKGTVDIGALMANDIAFKESGGNLYAYVAPTSNAAQFKVLKITEPGGVVTFQDLGFVTFSATLYGLDPNKQDIQSVEVVGNRLFVVHAGSGLYSFDISNANASAPKQETNEYLLPANNNSREFLFHNGFFYNAHGDAGLYIMRYVPPPVSCANDSGCDPYAVCISDSCVPRLSHGTACSRNEVCGSGHCQNGFCCGTGDCCASASDCPASYESAATCDNSVLCQGSRQEKSCSEKSECGSTSVADNSGCAALASCGGGDAGGSGGISGPTKALSAKGCGCSLVGSGDLGLLALLGVGLLVRRRGRSWKSRCRPKSSAGRMHGC